MRDEVIDERDHPTHCVVSLLVVLPFALGFMIASEVGIYRQQCGAPTDDGAFTVALVFFLSTALVMHRRLVSASCAQCAAKLRRSHKDSRFGYFPCPDCRITWRSRFRNLELVRE